MTTDAERLARIEALVEPLASLPNAVSKLQEAGVGLQALVSETRDHVKAQNGRLSTMERLVWMAMGGLTFLSLGVPVLTFLISKAIE